MADLANPFSCDVCSVIKGASNHWWRVWKANPETEAFAVLITPWEFLPKVKHYHACGVEHALRLAAKLMDPAAVLPQE